jgi:uncharacterized protein
MNARQLRFLRFVVSRCPELTDLDSLVRAARASAGGVEGGREARAVVGGFPVRREVESRVLEPSTGKAFEVRAGQVLRVAQIDGGQCVDLNIFTMADRRERLHVGRTRGMQGPHPAAGDVLWSNAPWERPIAAIVRSTTVTDTYFPYCSRLIYAALFGVHDRLNCQDIQNEAQREYGLKPWELHESLNLFMHTTAESIEPNLSRPGDHIEFYALHDLLMVPNVCADDLTNCSNYGQHPVRVTIEESLPADEETAREACARSALLGLAPPAHPSDAEPLRRDPEYRPDFPSLPPGQVDLGAPDAVILAWALTRLGTFSGNP